MKKFFSFFFIVVLISAFTADKSTVTGVNGGTPLSAELLGENERPNPGDPDGYGTFEMTLNQGQGTISYVLTVSNIEPARAAHIHIGGADVAGDVVLHLAAPTNGMSSGVIQNVSKELIKAIRQNPEGYYVNVHNAEYPGGAVRGQLMK